jgi:L,D-peptidoglycan transpeptidase YkuD (ErfK/YbiS/YcfS/YnhG family)
VLGVAAVVAVVVALPDGADPTARAAAASSSAAPARAVIESSSPTTSTAVRVPAHTEMTDPTAEGADVPAADSGSAAADAPGGSETPGDATSVTLPDPPDLSVTPPPMPPAPVVPAAPAQPAVPTAPATAPAKTTAPKTTAPQTTAARTTAAKTTAPKTTAPTTTAPTKPNFTIPVTLGNASQLITVTAPSASATSGTLRAWQKSASGAWRVVYGPVKAWVGSAGIGTASETTSRTPLGTFTLTEAFGRLDDPGTALPYHKTGPNDWWVSDTKAATYNTLQTCAQASCPFNTRVSEHLQSITPYYNYAVVMDVNRSPVVAGAGSAFFLHVSVGKPTAGCVAIDSSTLVSIMRWLNPAQHPRIATGIG